MEKFQKDWIRQQISKNPRLAIDVLTHGGYSASDPDVLFHFGLASFVMKDYSQAEKYFRQCLALGRNTATVLFYIGWSMEKQSKMGDALTAYRTSLSLDSNMKGAQEGIYRLTGTYEEARPVGPSHDPTRLGSTPSTETSGAIDDPRVQSQQSPVGSIGLPPRRPSTKHGIVGRVRSAKWKSVAFNGQMNAKQSLSFRVDIPDSAGNLERSMQVEIRGFRISGSAEDGDWVELGIVSPSGDVKGFDNITTGQYVKTRFF